MVKGLNKFIARSNRFTPWLGFAGCLIFLGGLSWDAVLHRLHPYLAIDEGIFSLSNPSHLIMGLGIGLIVCSTVLFLLKQLQQSKKRTLAGQLLLVGAIFSLMGLCGINLVLATRDNSSNFAEVVSDQLPPLSINEAIQQSNSGNYSFYTEDNPVSTTQNSQPVQHSLPEKVTLNLPVAEPKPGVFYLPSQHDSKDSDAAPVTGADARLENLIDSIIIDLSVFGLLFLLSFFIKEPALATTNELLTYSPKSGKARPKKITAFTDLLVISTICIVVFVLAIIFDLFEQLQRFIIQYRMIRLDEILVVLIMLGFALAIFSLRRWRELKEEIKERKAVALQNAQLFQQAEISRERAQMLAQMLVEAQETERRRVAYELHDEVGQALTAIKINLQISRRNPASQHILPQIEDSISIVEQALQQVRNLSFDLRPSMLDDLGLAAALSSYTERLTQRIGLTPRISTRLIETRVAPYIETTCFRIAQEALTNILRHAQAQQVCVELEQFQEELVLTISDDGKGFDVNTVLERATHGKSLGLLGMQERTLIAGGKLEFESSPNNGARIIARFPLTIPQVLQPTGV
jgi:signal transduction histidine kinase